MTFKAFVKQKHFSIPHKIKNAMFYYIASHRSRDIEVPKIIKSTFFADSAEILESLKHYIFSSGELIPHRNIEIFCIVLHSKNFV